VPHGDVAAERVQHGLFEDLGDQAHVLEHDDARPVTHRDASRFLATVLKGVKAEVGEFADLLARRPDTEYTACVLGAVIEGVKVVG